MCSTKFLSVLLPLLAVIPLSAQVPSTNVSTLLEPDTGPILVHVFEDYETDIEKRWWLRGVVVTNDLAPSLSLSVPNRHACRATETKDFDDKMGDPTKLWKAVIFNPVPGPPMGSSTRLHFRYKLQGTDTLRVQIYSLTKNFHRHLTLTNLVLGTWQTAAMDMTRARRPDGSGGPLSQDERIDDIQFYISPEADLWIDDIVLYERLHDFKRQRFPARIVFTGWFDTGQQGQGHEWPGDFLIEKHSPPRTWKFARSVPDPQTNRPWIRLGLRGARPLSARDLLSFVYHVSAPGPIEIALEHSATAQRWTASLKAPVHGSWRIGSVQFDKIPQGALADQISFRTGEGIELFLDNVLLYEPGWKTTPREPNIFQRIEDDLQMEKLDPKGCRTE